MAAKKGGLGKGLDALFVDNSMEEQDSSKAVKLRISQVEPNRAQPRKTFDETALAELSDSISQHGIIQPLLVRPLPDGSYQIVAGERRWRAARIAGLTEIPVIIRDLSDEETMELALIENLQREDLNPIEESEGLQLLMDTYGLTQDEVAKRVGCSRPTVANALRLLNLPIPVKEMLRTGKISAGHARALLSFKTEEELIKTAGLIAANNLSVRQVEKMAQQANSMEDIKIKTVKSGKNIFYEEVELALNSELRRKVKIINGKGGRGRIEIEFFSKNDLKELANTLAGEKGEFN